VIVEMVSVQNSKRQKRQGRQECLPHRFLVCAIVALWVVGTASAHAEGVDFSREVRPILSSKCFACHGPDEKARKAGLRLDRFDEVIKPAKDGAVPVVPGKPEASEIIKRVSSADEDEMMPPAKASATRLSGAQVEVLRRWIAGGAEYKQHWAYVKPVRAALPEVKGKWGVNEIDQFVLARLEKEG
jgi:mono/diheme cytochrome c family protein